jgi:hypothetical protein
MLGKNNSHYNNDYKMFIDGNIIREMPTATATVVIGAERICIEIELYITLIYMLIESLRNQSDLIYKIMGELI